MAKSFAEVRAAQDNIREELKNKFDKAKGSGQRNSNKLDETYWSPNHVRGPNGTGYAKLRLLPATDGENDVFVKYEQFTKQGVGGWYIERNRHLLDGKDPANEYNMTIWQDQDLTKDQKISKIAQKSEFYIVNIYVEKDPNKPENEGKVFRWQFGRQIFNIIEKEMFPDKELFPDKEGVLVFDPIEGATLTLRVTTKEITRDGKTASVPSYEQSTFEAPTPMFGGDLEKFDKIWKQQYSLASEIAEDKFKSYEDLKDHFDKVMGFGKSGKQNFLDSDEPISRTSVSANQQNSNLSDEMDDDIPFDVGQKEEATSSTSSTSASDDEDWFNKLMK